MNKYYFIFCAILGLSCSEVGVTDNKLKEELDFDENTLNQDSTNNVSLLQVYGDFDGDEIIDTLREVLTSKVSDFQIENPFYNKWDKQDKIIGDEERPSIALVSNNKSIDTFHIGYGAKLYCLINIGDNDLDGRDEIAYVRKFNQYPYGVNPTDTAIANDCYIFKLYGNKWVEITSFRVNEKVFEKKDYVFNDIPGFLERKNGKWMYLDYTKFIEDTTGRYKEMRKLKVEF